ncbi:His-Xaa-Ser system radical SAM maturase HxsB [Psychromonas aquatilis]|uniref:His-Xaa-Ser system radical SAM maturase HxsB n=1 Tax=Psychromonas aquatilis TaxID=2005072 RepID=A0ABU9GTT1_9GAMM
MSKFQSAESYSNDKYKLLPIRFSEAYDNKYIVTNMVGEYEILDFDIINRLVNNDVIHDKNLLGRLYSKHFIYDGTDHTALKLLGLKYRSKISRLKEFTSLHMVVVSLRCDYTCSYCQVSRQGLKADFDKYDMSIKTADKVIDLIFSSPSKGIKVEFQGGESLLNFKIIKYITEICHLRGIQENRNVQFVIATNLSMLDDEIINFIKKYNIYVSTSLDGPRSLHDRNRPKPENDGYDLTIKGIKNIQENVSLSQVTALMTTTGRSLDYGIEIVDEYIKNDLSAIFLRPLSPYGFAITKKQINQYDTDRWLEFFKNTLDYIININKNGYNLMEQYSSLILTKILSPKDLGYVDLQSPSGAMIGGIIYDYDGSVYASDEARMQAAMGNFKFKLGHVDENSYEEMIGGEFILDAIDKSMSVSVPSCTSCAFLPYCGSDPVYHFATQNNVVGNKQISGYCKKNMGVFKHLINLLENSDEETKRILQSWVRY